MGGIDVMDRLLAPYRPNMKGKKWYWTLIVDALNVYVVAAWKIHCKTNQEELAHLDFRREITLCLLNLVSQRVQMLALRHLQTYPMK